MAASFTTREIPQPLYDTQRKTRALALLAATDAGLVVQIPRLKKLTKNDSFAMQLPDGNRVFVSRPVLTLVRLGYVEAGPVGDMGVRQMSVTDKGHQWMRNPKRHV